MYRSNWLAKQTRCWKFNDVSFPCQSIKKGLGWEPSKRGPPNWSFQPPVVLWKNAYQRATHREEGKSGKRSRSFQPSWKATYTWFRFVDLQNVLWNLCGLWFSKSELCFRYWNEQFPFGFNKESWKFCTPLTGHKRLCGSIQSWASSTSKGTCCRMRRSAIEDGKVIWDSLFCRQT